MKVILGVDSQDAFRPAVCLLNRLQPPKAELLLLHAADVTMPWSGIYGEANMQDEYTKAMENIGRSALDRAVDDACAHEFLPKRKLVFGSAASSIIYEASNSEVDIVTVNATHRGMWSSTFLGSVSRALVVACPKSVLISKGDRKFNQPLKAVFATDHSDYCNKALDRFLSWRLNGIGEIEVVSAFQLDSHHNEVLARGVKSVSPTVCEYVQEKIEAKNKEVVAKLAAAGYKACSRAVRGPANDAIRQCMQEFDADLLIVGAQGHGFFERMLVGSVALHQAVSEPYPVLLVRA